MNRRAFLAGSGAFLLSQRRLRLEAAEAAPQPLVENHFPDRLHQFVWRNWELANADRMAQVAGCSTSNILDIGRSMGLPPKLELTAEQLRRIYITVIRQNWHLLPNEQLIELLGWDRGRFEFTLKEDDFLDIKLGPKPVCSRVTYTEPGPEAKKRAAEMRQTLATHLGAMLNEPGEAPFRFVDRLSEMTFPPLRDAGGPPESFLDLSACRLASSDSVDPRVTERFEQYLRQSMRCTVSSDAGVKIDLRLDAGISSGREAFRIEAHGQRVEVTGKDGQGLLQGIYWLEDQMEQNGGPFLAPRSTQRESVFHPRYLYSYFALYGDPLLETDIDPFPDAYLEKLARSGMNGVWLQGVLNTLAPSKEFPEFGGGSEKRLETLRALVDRASQFGIGIYLYLNEPRAMPPAFFDRYPAIKGEPHRDLYAMCTSTAVVREWIADSLTHINQQVPDLGGFFVVTMSENHTNCFSHGNTWTQAAPVAKVCPRCSRRKSWDAQVELIQTFHNGIRRAGSKAELIVYDWGWPDEMTRETIPRLPKDVGLLGVSEWYEPVERGGVSTKVGEYSISVVGPGPRAKANWALARENGLAAMAKTQFNNTWEISAVPYIPVPNLIARHCSNLSRAGVSGIMASWTLGGYPSPNLEVAKEFYFSPAGEADEILERVARRRYGDQAAPLVLEAWKGFSDAFEEFPYGVAVYVIPTQHGPANLLRARPTGVRPTMILFPQDNPKSWSGDYPPAVVQSQFAKMAAMWEAALPLFHKAVAQVPATKKDRAEEDLTIAETCFLHFRSVAVQIEFYRLRDSDAPDRDRLRALAQEQRDLARRQYGLARRRSVIGFEASNHYYYRPLDLAEQILNCQYLLDRELSPKTNG